MWWKRKSIISPVIIAFGSIFLGLQYWFIKDKLLKSTGDAVYNSGGLTKRTRVAANSVKLILFYTPLFGRIPWPGIANDHNFTNWSGIPCAVQACRISYNKTELMSSDVVIFHGRDMPSVKHMKHMLNVKPIGQKWVYFMHESPKFMYYDPSLYNGFFNWMMSYRTDSDFFVPYRTYVASKSVNLGSNLITTDYSKGKDRLIVWVVSNCGGLREIFVRKLMKYIKVDVYGKCSVRFNQTKTCPRSSLRCRDILKRYKFALALENSYCDDYITEKYWYTPLDHKIIPVVLGGSNYDKSLAIPGSFINALDFSSAESLAQYLLHLHINKTAYNEYFRWKRQYKAVLPESWTCQMCAALNNDTAAVKVYNNMEDLWGEKSACEENEKRVQAFTEE